MADGVLPVILADDLTGALDAGVSLAGRFTQPVFCVWNSSALQDTVLEGVLVVDTESRNIPEHQAIAAVSSWSERLNEAGRSISFKKIDSTMRGHVAAELDAILDGNPALRGALVCPTLPEQGRVVRDGRLFVNGTPLEETGLARDPLAPVPSGLLSDILGRTHFPMVPVPSGAPIEPIADGRCLYICDASTVSDLNHLALIARQAHLLPVGSAGLAQAWANGAEPEHTALACRKPMAFVCGTPAGATRRQVDALLKERPDVLRIRPDRKTLLAPVDDPKRTQDLNQAAEAVHNALANGQSVLLDFVHMEKKDIAAQEGDPEVITTGARRILSAMHTVAPSLSAAGTLVFLGGDTARTLLDAARATAVEIRGEFLPQIPYGRVVGGEWDGRSVLTKAGGFGDRQALIRLLDAAGES